MAAVDVYVHPAGVVTVTGIGQETERCDDPPPEYTRSVEQRIPPPEDRQQQQQGEIYRRPDIDLIRILISGGSLLYYTTLIYIPEIPYFLKDPNYDSQNEQARRAGHIFLYWAEAWAAPTIFFISGLNVFSSFHKRDLTSFRWERYHRLLVPAFAIMAVTQLPLSFAFLAKLPPNCRRSSEANTNASEVKDNSTHDHDPCLVTRGDETGLTAASYVDGFWNSPPHEPSPLQGWILVYIFLYAEVLAGVLYLWHPSSPFESTTGCICIPDRSFLCCCCRRAGSPTAFSKRVNSFLGSEKKLALIPGAVLAVPEMILRPVFPEVERHFLSVFYDIPSDLNFGFVFFLGFAFAADDSRLRPIAANISRLYFWAGNASLLCHALLKTFYGDKFVAAFFSGMFRGFGEWMFILGLVGLCRSRFTTNSTRLSTFFEMSLPFFLTNQQILVAVASGLLSLRVINNFVFVFVIATVAAVVIAGFVVKSGPLRYFFGLSVEPDSPVPGKKWHGLVPGIFLVILLVLEIISVAGVRG